MPKIQQRGPEWIAEAPIQIRHCTTIEGTPDQVWQELTTNKSWVDWFPGFRLCRFTSDQPHGVGSIRLVHQDRFKVTERITAWVPEQRWAMTVIEINLPVVTAMAEDVVLSPTGPGTTVDWRIGVELSRWASPLRKPLEAKSANGLEQALSALAERVSSPTTNPS